MRLSTLLTFCYALLLLGSNTQLLAQPDTARQLSYAPPLRGALRVTGTFGELRSNHFHAGLDFRAATNTPVYAVAEGFVSRISIRSGGYGQAVYVDHPDGHRSVYAHLETLAPALRDTVFARQMAAEDFAQDLHFAPHHFPIKQGDRIGGVGNRGHSFGPHLHFEMRRSRTDAPLNPLAFGFSVPDTRPPRIRQLRIYELTEDGHERTSRTLTPLREGNTYRIRDTLTVNSSRVGFALKTYDQQNGMPNWNGIYGGELLVDSLPLFTFRWDEIPFEQTEYLNALTDYAAWQTQTSWYHRFWALTQDAMFWREAGDRRTDGSLRLPPNAPRTVELRVRDFAGNTTELHFVLRYQPAATPPLPRPHQYFLPAGEASIIDNGDLRLELAPDALYRDAYFQYARLPERSAGYFSDVHQLHLPTTPLHGEATLALRPQRPVPDTLRSALFVGQCQPDGQWTAYGGTWTDDGRLRARIPTFGDYALLLDTIPPTVAIRRMPTDLRRQSGFSLLIDDNVSGPPLRYRGTIDGQWALLEYDEKNKRLNYAFRHGDPGPGKHLFRLEVYDHRGNSTVWERSFQR